MSGEKPGLGISPEVEAKKQQFVHSSVDETLRIIGLTSRLVSGETTLEGLSQEDKYTIAPKMLADYATALAGSKSGFNSGTPAELEESEKYAGKVNAFMGWQSSNPRSPEPRGFSLTEINDFLEDTYKNNKDRFNNANVALLLENAQVLEGAEGASPGNVKYARDIQYDLGQTSLQVNSIDFFRESKPENFSKFSKDAINEHIEKSNKTFGKANLSNMNLSGLDLRGVNFTNYDEKTGNPYLLDMTGANLTGTNLAGVNLSNVKGLTSEQLAKSGNLSGVVVSQEQKAMLQEAVTSPQHMVGKYNLGPKFLQKEIDSFRQNNSPKEFQELSKNALNQYITESSKISGKTNLKNVNLSDLDLTGVNFVHYGNTGQKRPIDMTGANLAGTNLKGVDLSEVKGLTSRQLAQSANLSGVIANQGQEATLKGAVNSPEYAKQPFFQKLKGKMGDMLGEISDSFSGLVDKVKKGYESVIYGNPAGKAAESQKSNINRDTVTSAMTSITSEVQEEKVTKVSDPNIVHGEERSDRELLAEAHKLLADPKNVGEKGEILVSPKMAQMAMDNYMLAGVMSSGNSKQALSEVKVKQKELDKSSGGQDKGVVLERDGKLSKSGQEVKDEPANSNSQVGSKTKGELTENLEKAAKSTGVKNPNAPERGAASGRA